jgi:hypothetical protein
MQKRKYPEYSGWLHAMTESSQPLTHPITTHPQKDGHNHKPAKSTSQRNVTLSHTIDISMVGWLHAMPESQPLTHPISSPPTNTNTTTPKRQPQPHPSKSK